jgi:excisionase family DNA binding protein
MASVYRKNNRWYMRVRDATGAWRDKPSTARNKTEAHRLASEFESKARRQRLGQEPMPVQGDATVASLCEWWLANRCPARSRSRESSRLRKHIISQPVGRILLQRATGVVFEERFRAMEQAGAAPATINGMRRVLHGVFAKATKAGLWPLQNPLDMTESRRVPKRTHATLQAEEVGALLSAAKPEWRGIFAVAIYAGLRKGEIFGLRKSDVDLRNGAITVARSYDNDTTKGGRADVIPIAEPLMPHLKAAMEASASDLVFPTESGEMRSPNSGVATVLRRTLVWAGLVDGYVHSCRRCKAEGQPHVERHSDDRRRRCPACKMQLWVKPVPRAMRFHDLRHTTATLLLRAGVDVVRVQRILRHSDVRLTADTYGHLVVEDLRAAVNSIAPQEVSDQGQGGADGDAKAGKAQEPPASQESVLATPGLDRKAQVRGLAQPPGRLMSVREVARRLNVCSATVYRLCQKGALAHSRVGNMIRVSEEQLRLFVQAEPVEVRQPAAFTPNGVAGTSNATEAA